MGNAVIMISISLHADFATASYFTKTDFELGSMGGTVHSEN